MGAAENTTPPLRRYDGSGLWIGLGVAAAVLFAAAIRVRLLELPLERDEGEYAYAGQLLLEGIPPYRLAYNMKFPGTYVAYAGILALFGPTTAGIRLGLLVVNSATIVLVFVLIRRLLGARGGVVGCATYALLSVGQPVLGIAGHATHFVVLPAVAGLRLLLDPSRPSILFLSGVLLGVAFMMKQPGGFFAVFGVTYLLWADTRTRPVRWARCVARLMLFGLGAALPLGLAGLLLFRAGVFEKFWLWTVSYAQVYALATPLVLGIEIFIRNFLGVVEPSWPLWLLGAIGLLSTALDRASPYRVFILGFALVSFLAICPGLYFRPHYFILLLPALGILAASAMRSAPSLLARIRPLARLPLAASRWLPVSLFVLALVYSVLAQRTFLFELSPPMAAKDTYASNPFPESRAIAEYIKAHSTQGDRIAVLGSEPQLYFLSNRRSATGHIYTYALMEPQPHALAMQQEMIREIEAAQPKFLVVVNVMTSWLVQPDSERLIFDWARRHLATGFSRVGVIDIVSMERTEYRWGADAAAYVPRSPEFLVVYQRTRGADAVTVPPT